MPLARIDLRKGKDLTYRQEIGRVAYEAMIAVGVGVPANARFQIVSEHDADNFLFDAGYLGIDRSDDLVIIQITWNEGRTAGRKKALYKAITEGSERHRASASRMSSSTSSMSGLRTGPSARAKPSTRLEKERPVSGVESTAKSPLRQILTDYKCSMYVFCL
jgi:4-oxalocrotonate tautomerase